MRPFGEGPDGQAGLAPRERMIKVKILATGEIQEVTPNVAFGLIDSGKATKVEDKPVEYKSRDMRPQATRRYKTK